VINEGATRNPPGEEERGEAGSRGVKGGTQRAELGERHARDYRSCGPHISSSYCDCRFQCFEQQIVNSKLLSALEEKQVLGRGEQQARGCDCFGDGASMVTTEKQSPLDGKGFGFQEQDCRYLAPRKSPQLAFFVFTLADSFLDSVHTGL